MLRFIVNLRDGASRKPWNCWELFRIQQLLDFEISCKMPKKLSIIIQIHEPLMNADQTFSGSRCSWLPLRGAAIGLGDGMLNL
jgi:hypothetical protein